MIYFQKNIESPIIFKTVKTKLNLEISCQFIKKCRERKQVSYFGVFLNEFLSPDMGCQELLWKR